MRDQREALHRQLGYIAVQVKTNTTDRPRFAISHTEATDGRDAPTEGASDGSNWTTRTSGGREGR